MSDPLQQHGLQHTRPPCPPLSPRDCPSSCPLNQQGEKPNRQQISTCACLSVCYMMYSLSKPLLIMPTPRAEQYPPPLTVHPLMPLSIVYDIATSVMNWYVLIFEMLRQEATHYKKKQCQDNPVRQRLEMDIVQENALKLKRVLFNMMVLKT